MSIDDAMPPEMDRTIREHVGDAVANAVADACHEAVRVGGRFDELGFEEDNFGQYVAQGCKVTIYPSCGEYEIDIILPGGGVIGFSVASLSSRTAAEQKPTTPAEQ
jgi:hypothetical protein